MSYDLEPRIINQIRIIAEKYLINKVVLFGSRARGDNRNNSDIDIAFYTLPGFSNEGSLVSDIQDIETLLKIDTVFINNDTDEKLIRKINNEGIVIYERLQSKI